MILKQLGWVYVLLVRRGQITQQRTVQSSFLLLGMQFSSMCLYLIHIQSVDLVSWTRHNDALTPIAGTNISTSNVVERPKGPYECIQVIFRSCFRSL